MQVTDTATSNRILKHMERGLLEKLKSLRFTCARYDKCFPGHSCVSVMLAAANIITCQKGEDTFKCTLFTSHHSIMYRGLMVASAHLELRKCHVFGINIKIPCVQARVKFRVICISRGQSDGCGMAI